MKISREIPVTIALLVATLPVQASLIGFTDRTTFETAIGGSNGSEDFNGFIVDTEFRTTSVASNNMSITGEPGFNGTITNKIDAAPFEISDAYVVNGTTYLIGDLRNPEQIRIDFALGVTAWGAEVSDVNEIFPDTKIDVFDNNNALLGSLSLLDRGDGGTGFNGFGFDDGEVVSYLIIRNTNDDFNDVFRIDDIVFRTSVPEPTTLALMGLGLAGIGYRRHQIGE